MLRGYGDFYYTLIIPREELPCHRAHPQNPLKFKYPFNIEPAIIAGVIPLCSMWVGSLKGIDLYSRISYINFNLH